MKKLFKGLMITIIAVLMLATSAFAVFAKQDYPDFETAISEFVADENNCITIYEDEIVPIPEQYNSVHCYYSSSDESIVEVGVANELCPYREGVAYIRVEDIFGDAEPQIFRCTVIAAPQDKEAIEQEKREKFEDFIAAFFGILGLCLLATLMLFIIVPTLHLSFTSTKRKPLPKRRETTKTVKISGNEVAKCSKCGRDFGDDKFCPVCGTARTRSYFYQIPIKGCITAKRLEKEVNKWLAENPYVYNCKIHLKSGRPLLVLISPFVNWKFFVKQAVIEYSIADEPQAAQYGLQFLYKFRFFGPLGYNNDKLVNEWKLNNPDSSVVSTCGSRIQHLGFSSGFFYAQYYDYVFFKRG